MNPFEMVVAIIVVVTIGSVIKAKYGIHKDRHGNEFRAAVAPEAGIENARLRDEIRSLKERVQVLERVITDNDSSLRLDAEIEKLRDKNGA
jgi:hypothetical protein